MHLENVKFNVKYTAQQLREIAKQNEGINVQSVVRYLMDNYDLQEDIVTVQRNEIAVLSGNGKDGFLKVVTGDDNQVYIEFLDYNGINSIKPGALITDLSDIDGALA